MPADLLTHLPIVLRPDPSRTVIRPFFLSDPDAFAVKGSPRAQRIADRILGLDKDALAAELKGAIAPLEQRHRNVEETFLNRYREMTDLGVDPNKVSHEQALLIGAYFSEEFSFESAALFNPSAVRHPDQSSLKAGDLRLLISLRGIGEGHVSSLIFRTGVWAANGEVTIDDPSPYAVAPQLIDMEGEGDKRIARMNCGGAKDISETVLFPFLPRQGLGLEDMRLVQFTEEDGSTDYRGTFTAFDGSSPRQAMLRTETFKALDMRFVQGSLAKAKGAALFPRRVAGQYVMLGRQDNENLWVLKSDDLYVWDKAEKILAPHWPWEFIQMGNCGSPIEIDEGWLVLTHAVGMLRNYCVGACLLDKDDPTKVLKRTPAPILAPSEQERAGYVPNVVYSCGALLRDRQLLLPYGVADNFCSFATVDVDALLAAMA